MRPSVRRFVGFGLIMVGIIILWFMTLSPLIHLKKAQSWVRVPCKIIRSEFSFDEYGASGSFSFQYKYDDQVFTRFYYNYEVLTPDRKRRIADQYENDQETLCYVDPNNPSDAIISNDFSYGYLIGLVGCVFIFSGLLLFYSAWFSDRRKPISKRYQWGEGVELKSAISPLMNISVASSFAAAMFFWGGCSGTISICTSAPRLVSSFSFRWFYL